MFRVLAIFLSLFFIISCNDSARRAVAQTPTQDQHIDLDSDQKLDSDQINPNDNSPTDADQIISNDNTQTDVDQAISNDNPQTDADQAISNDNPQTDADQAIPNDNSQTDTDQVISNDNIQVDTEETPDQDNFVPECKADKDCPQIDGAMCKTMKCVSQKCVLKPLPKGTSCENGIFCDGKDTCDGNGKCVASNVSPCGANACVEGTGCCDPGFAGEDCKTCVRFVTPTSVKTPNGLTWHTAFTKIQDAIASTKDKCEIWVKKGTYNENVIQPEDNLTILGGFLGTESLSSKRNWKTNKTIIDGKKEHPVFVLENLKNVKIDGFTIQNGNSTAEMGDPEEYDFGGGLFIGGTQANLNHLIIQNNYARKRGGGLIIENNSDVELRNSVIKNNSSDYLGGGIAVYDNSSALFVNIVVANNKTKNYGAGICTTNYSSAEIVNATIAFNSLDYNQKNSGSGLHFYKSEGSVLNSIIGNNKNGPQIKSYKTTLKVSYSNIQGGFSGDGNIDKAPLFISQTDLRLSEKSPCIDMAQNPTKSNNVSETDINGNKRYDFPGKGKTKTDMGAYEVIQK